MDTCLISFLAGLRGWPTGRQPFCLSWLGKTWSVNHNANKRDVCGFWPFQPVHSVISATRKRVPALKKDKKPSLFLLSVSVISGILFLSPVSFYITPHEFTSLSSVPHLLGREYFCHCKYSNDIPAMLTWHEKTNRFVAACRSMLRDFLDVAGVDMCTSFLEENGYFAFIQFKG